MAMVSVEVSELDGVRVFMRVMLYGVVKVSLELTYQFNCVVVVIVVIDIEYRQLAPRTFKLDNGDVAHFNI